MKGLLIGIVVLLAGILAVAIGSSSDVRHSLFGYSKEEIRQSRQNFCDTARETLGVGDSVSECYANLIDNKDSCVNANAVWRDGGCHTAPTPTKKSKHHKGENIQ